MINFRAGVMGFNMESADPITKWQVWFQTPFGIYDNLPDAAERCKTADLEPDMNIVPVPVAINKYGQPEVCRR